jgi:hypothetical protein
MKCFSMKDLAVLSAAVAVDVASAAFVNVLADAVACDDFYGADFSSNQDQFLVKK